MTVEIQQDIAVGSGDHVVEFYEEDAELARTVGAYLTDAAQAGAVAIVVATEDHRRAFQAELTAAGLDAADACGDGRLVLLDAAEMLARFMPEGRIDGDAFHRVIGAVVRKAAESGRPIRVYGEMVALLWEAGDVLAAIELERLWNDLGRELEFGLLCAYHSEAVSGSEHADALQQICHLHSAVWHEPRRDHLNTRAHPPAPAEVCGQFPATYNAPHDARHFVSEALSRWEGCDALLADAQLVVTELATNAVVHARSPFSVVARSEHSGVRISVHDASSVAPTLRDRGLMAASGRGLRLVAAIAADWGVEITADGKTVWAQLRP